VSSAVRYTAFDPEGFSEGETFLIGNCYWEHVSKEDVPEMSLLKMSALANAAGVYSVERTALDSRAREVQGE
jgi:hypothetical protein